MMIQDNTNNDDSKPNPPTLPIELIFEILQLLPVLSLLRCKSVCKVWLSLISSPDFVKTHLLKSLENTEFANRRLISKTFYPPKNRMEDCSVCYILNEHEPFHDTPRVECPTKDPSNYIEIVGTCNGLLCLATSNHPLNGPLFLWNPTTRKSKELLISEKIMNYKTYETEYGFGYDECSDDYKVVATFSSVKEDVEEENDAKKIEVEIYSLRLDCWRSIEDIPCRRTCGGGGLLHEPVKFANGTLHWLATHEINYSSEDDWIILSLDLKTEKFGEVVQPKYREGDYYLTLGDLERSLCVLCSYRNFETDVWVMNEYGVKESWMILARIPRIGNPLPNWFVVPRCVSGSGDIVVDSDYGLVVYNYKDCTLKKIDSRKFSGCGTTLSYIESLVSPNV